MSSIWDVLCENEINPAGTLIEKSKSWGRIKGSGYSFGSHQLLEKRGSQGNVSRRKV
jgi:hypothetical protein